MFEVIPAIDLIDGQVVRLTQGDYGQVQRYSLTPEETAKRFEDAGATRIHLVDLDGAKDGNLTNLKTIESIRNTVSCTLELGGGIRSLDTARHLISVGINYLILGSLLIKNFSLAESIINQFPGQIIAGIDAKNGFVATEGWLDVEGITAVELVEKLGALPIAAVIYTDIAKDGTLAGPNLEQVRLVAKHSSVPVIASGGVGNLAHIESVRALSSEGVSGCIVGKAVLGGHIPLDRLFV